MGTEERRPLHANRGEEVIRARADAARAELVARVRLFLQHHDPTDSRLVGVAEKDPRREPGRPSAHDHHVGVESCVRVGGGVVALHPVEAIQRVKAMAKKEPILTIDVRFVVSPEKQCSRRPFRLQRRSRRRRARPSRCLSRRTDPAGRFVHRRAVRRALPRLRRHRRDSRDVRRLGPTPTTVEVEALAQAKRPFYMRRAEAELVIFEGAANVVRARAAKGPVAIVSGALRDEITFALERMGLSGVVEIIVSAEDTTRCKPDPMGYELGIAALAARVGLERAKSALVIEDSLAGIESGQKRRVLFVWR